MITRDEIQVEWRNNGAEQMAYCKATLNMRCEARMDTHLAILKEASAAMEDSLRKVILKEIYGEMVHVILGIREKFLKADQGHFMAATGDDFTKLLAMTRGEKQS